MMNQIDVEATVRAIRRRRERERAEEEGATSDTGEVFDPVVRGFGFGLGLGWLGWRRSPAAAWVGCAAL